MNEHPSSPAHDSSPMRFLPVAALFTSVVFVWFGWNTYGYYHVASVVRPRYFSIHELESQITHMDEVLTMSARMAAATGDLAWEQGYHRYEPNLTSAIKDSTPAALETKGTETMDPKTALARVEGDAQLWNEIARIFVVECPRMMGEIRQALRDLDAKELERASHTMKGSLGNFAATGAFEAALRLERIARAQGLEEAPIALERLEHEIARLIPVLTSLETGVMPCKS